MSGTGRQAPNDGLDDGDVEHPLLSSPLNNEVEDISIEASLAINKGLKHRRAKQKGSIDRKSPLGLKRRAKTQLDLQGEHLSALLQAKEAVSRLPKQSSYAKHRMACIDKALSLLETQR